MWVLKSFLLAVSQLPMKALGLILVPIGLLFKVTYPETRQAFTDPRFTGEWELVRLPLWLKWYDNIYDGFLGDKRGWWDNWCKENYGKDCRSFKAMFQWGAVRNPTNYFGRSVISMDVSRCKVVKLAGNCDLPSEEAGTKEWVHLVAYSDNGQEYHRFFLSWAFDKWPDHGIQIDVGYKIKLSHNGMSTDSPDKDKLRSPVFTLTPWKKLT